MSTYAALSACALCFVCVVQVIPGSGEPTVQVLAWVKGTGEPGEEDGERLLSAGLNARVIEWDLLKLLPKNASDSYGGAVWCGALSPNGERLALGCEDGSIRVFDVVDTGSGSSAPAYAFGLFGHTGRVLSVGWSPDNTQLVTGGSDSTIRQWLLATQRNTARIAVETLGKQKTLVWAVKMLKSVRLSVVPLLLIVPFA
jgi:U3 small nucleolar RNA-associated protein 4